MSREGALVALEGAAVGYGGRPLLGEISLAIGRGAFLGIVGPNGGGKTTLLRVLLGVLPPIRGRRDALPGLAFGYVPQRDQVDAIWPLTVGEVVSMGRTRLVPAGRRPGPADREAVLRAVEQVGMADLAGRAFRDLSGGQRQRTLIARALAGEPDLLALDEPTNGMDPAGELDVMELVRALNRRGLAVAMVSHRLDVVLNHASQLAFVDHHRGLWRVGSLPEMLTADALGALYGRPVEVRREGGRVQVVPAGRGGAA